MTLAGDLGEHRLKDLSFPEHVWQIHHPRLPSEFAPLKSLDSLPNNLPRQLTSFIGREKEMTKIKDLLHGPRLVTLTGRRSGTGKTRGWRFRQRLRFWSSIRTARGWWSLRYCLRDPDLASQTAASVLGLKEEPGKSITPVLLDYLKGTVAAVNAGQLRALAGRMREVRWTRCSESVQKW